MLHLFAVSALLLATSQPQSPQFDISRLNETISLSRGEVLRDCIDNAALADAARETVNGRLWVAGSSDHRVSVTISGKTPPKLDATGARALIPNLRSWLQGCLAVADLVPLDAASGQSLSAISFYIVIRSASEDNKKSNEYVLTADSIRKLR